MTKVLAICTFFAALVWAVVPAVAQEITSHDDAQFVGRLLITNHPTTQTDIYSTHTVGDVEVNVHYHSTPNTLPDPRDIITITAPDGYIAIPSEVLLPEFDVIEVVIYEATLG